MAFAGENAGHSSTKGLARALFAASLFAAQGPFAAHAQTVAPSAPPSVDAPAGVGEGELRFETPGAGYEVAIERVVPEHACAAPCTLRLAPGQWRVGTAWPGGDTATDYLGIAPGSAVTRSYSGPPPASGQGSRRGPPPARFVVGAVFVGLGALSGLYGISAMAAWTVLARSPCSWASCSEVRDGLFESGLGASLLGLPVALLGAWIAGGAGWHPLRASARARPVIVAGPTHVGVTLAF